MKEKPVNQLIRYAYYAVILHYCHYVTASFLSTVQVFFFTSKLVFRELTIHEKYQLVTCIIMWILNYYS